jgi:hypothetical protein
MVDVPEYLVPMDGLTNSAIRLEGMDVGKGGGANFRFEMRDEDGQFMGRFVIPVEPTKGPIDLMFAEAHRKMRDVLRQWVHSTDTTRQAYEKIGE